MSQFRKYWDLREVYQAIFHRESRQPAQVKSLLDDLREFCRADTSCVVIGKDGHIDTNATMIAEGRRECFLRIQQILSMTDETLLKLKENEDE
jgi:hypothetical protein